MEKINYKKKLALLERRAREMINLRVGILLFCLMFILGFFIINNPIEGYQCPVDYRLEYINNTQESTGMCLSNFEGLENPEVKANYGPDFITNLGVFLLMCLGTVFLAKQTLWIDKEDLEYQ